MLCKYLYQSIFNQNNEEAWGWFNLNIAGYLNKVRLFGGLPKLAWTLLRNVFIFCSIGTFKKVLFLLTLKLETHWFEKTRQKGFKWPFKCSESLLKYFSESFYSSCW